MRVNFRYLLAAFVCLCSIFPGAGEIQCDSIFDENSRLFFSIVSENPPEVSVAMSKSISDIWDSYPEISGELHIPAKVFIEGKEYIVCGVNANAFSSNKKITSLSLPDGIRTIGERAFYDCVKLQNIFFSAALRNIGREAFAGTAVKEVRIPPSVTMVEEKIFSYCRNLQRVEWWPETAIGIPSGTFRGTGLQTGDFGDKIVSLGDFSFEDIPSLQILTFRNPQPPRIYGMPFRNSELSLTSLIVPAGSEELYASASGWQGLDFLEIGGISGDVLPEEIILSAPRQKIEVGESVKVSVRFTPADVTRRDVVWSSSDSSIASVDNNGIVTGLSPGNTTVSAVSSENSVIFGTISFSVVSSSSDGVEEYYRNDCIDNIRGRIITFSGVTLFEGDITSLSSLPDFESGIYILISTLPEGKVFTRKINIRK